MDRCARCFGDLDDLAVFCPHCAQAHEPKFARLIDSVIDGRYRIYRRLSQGGLSSVFAATDLETDRIVVIKISDPAQLVRRESSYSIDSESARRYWSEMIERMQREVEHLAEMDHPNIVRVLGSGTINQDLRYVVMEFLQGQTLRTVIDRDGRFDTSAAMSVIRQICQALEAIHQRGIVHRDINPSNIILCGDDRSPDLIKLIDFGIAKFPQPAGAPPFTRNSSLRGTVAYSSPEQCQSLEVGPRSDIYSLAIVCFELLTGQRPFDGRTPTEIALKHIQTTPPEPRSINADIPAGLSRAILRALAKDPAERPETVTEFLQELETGSSQFTISLESRSGEQEDETQDDSVERVRLARRRRRRLAVAGAALLVALAAGGLLMAGQMLSWRGSPEQSAGTEVQGSPQPNGETDELIFGSDADSLELAARSSQLRDFRPPVPFQIKTAPITSPRLVKAVDKATRSLPGKAASKATPKTTPVARPAGGKPKAPPVRDPVVSPRQIPAPGGQPDLSQSPDRRSADKAESQAGASRDDDRQPAQDLPEHRDQTVSDRPPAKSPENRSASSKRNDRKNPQIGPKLIQWSGSVNRVREIKIEMPGLPGTIDIPRVYRNRVAVVEPPNPSNDWEYAILRVFGRGNVSFLIRWWPMNQNQIADLQ
ncbi:MAG: protein kinase [Acidobacteriota bacterium]|nr:MAG: protein kinase [Acidobacteriota bacterium]